MNAPLRILEDHRLDQLGLGLSVSPHLRLLGGDTKRMDSRTKEHLLSLFLPSQERMESAVRRCWPERSRNDSNTVAFAGELRHVFTEVIKAPMPEYQFANGDFAPFITDVPLGKNVYEYRMLSYAGHAEVLNSYAWRQLPRITIGADIQVGRVHRFGCCWSITEDDELAAKHTVINIETELGVGAKRAHLQRWDRDFAFGNGQLGLTGMLNHPNVPVIDAPLNGAASSTYWKYKTGEEIVSDLKIVLRYLPGLTAELEKPDTVLMAPDEMVELSTRKMSTASDTTILEFLEKAFKVTFKECNACAASASGGNLATNIIFAYKANDKSKVGHVVVEPFRQREPMQDGLEKVVICTSGEGGTLVRQPYSMVRMDGVGLS